MFFFDKLDEFALREHNVGEVEAGEFVLLRQRGVETTQFGQALVEPVVERTVRLEFQRANGVRNVF